MMMESLLKNQAAINAALVENNKPDLVITQDQFKNMKAICIFLKEFRDIGTKLGQDDDVTITRVLPVWHFLETLLKRKTNDNPIVRKMKPVMLAKLQNRYRPRQMKFFRMCTLLDVRYKNNNDFYPTIQVYNEAYEDLENNVRHIIEENNKITDNSSPEVIPGTQGQELENLSNMYKDSQAKRQKFETYAHKGDAAPLYVDEPLVETGIANEIKKYQSVYISSGVEKDKLNILDWWKKHREIYPCLYQAVKCTLSIPATSVPAERIFSLAGFLVTKRRARLMSDKVNKIIFLNRNREFIPEKNTVYAIEEPAASISRE